MKKLKIIGLLIGTLLVGFVAGGYLGARRTAQVFGRMMYAKPEIDQAFNAAEQAEWLAELRLNETNSVMNEMEISMNAEVAAIASWDGIAIPDEQTRQARDKFLVPVKVYRESYPASGHDARRINNLLSTISGRNPKSTCRSGICRLDDLRLSKSSATTNYP